MLKARFSDDQNERVHDHVARNDLEGALIYLRRVGGDQKDNELRTFAICKQGELSGLKRCETDGTIDWHKKAAAEAKLRVDILNKVKQHQTRNPSDASMPLAPQQANTQNALAKNRAQSATASGSAAKPKPMLKCEGLSKREALAVLAGDGMIGIRDISQSTLRYSYQTHERAHGVWLPCMWERLLENKKRKKVSVFLPTQACLCDP